MYRTAFLVILIVLTGCQKKAELKYETKTLECLDALLSQEKSGNEKETIQLLEKYSDEYKFAADLKSNYSDRLAINTAKSTANSGQISKAKDMLESQVVERGYSDTLETSLKNIDKALLIQKYMTNGRSLGISERAREFSELKAHTANEIKEIPEYSKWIASEEESISEVANDDKKEVLKSLMFTTDYISLNKPKLLETLLLEIAVHEESAVIPGQKDLVHNSISTALKNKGVENTAKYSYGNNFKSHKDAENKGIPSLQKQLSYTHLLAKAGQISKTLESLQELNDLCEIDRNYRRMILKELFLSKGWNDASLINRNFLDISYLLETVYKSNQ